MSQPIPTVLSNIAKITGLLGIGLFYTGWIYRWAYFGYYQINLASLDYSLQSFLFVPLQALFGNLNTIALSLLCFAAITLCVWGSRKLLNQFLKRAKTRDTFPLAPKFIIIFWVIFLLFHLAKYQGITDARRDVIDTTSTRPFVTLISNEKALILGKATGALTEDQPLVEALTETSQQALIGSSTLAEKIQKENLSDSDHSWRLLLQKGSWLYLYRTLSSNAQKNSRPLVLAIP